MTQHSITTRRRSRAASASNRHRRRLFLETLEQRHLLASDFQNSFNEFDVNDDGFVSPLDALIIFNELNTTGPHPLPPSPTPPLAFVDVSGDSSVDPIDALLVFNVLNAGELPIVALTEDSAFVQEDLQIVSLPTIAAGTRTIRFNVAARFDKSDPAASEDHLLVYVVHAANPSQTLLSRGAAGTNIFALVGSQGDAMPGLVRFDGKTVEIDATTLPAGPVGLKFQLINSDADLKSRITVRALDVTTDVDGIASPSLAAAAATVGAGPALDISTLAASTQFALHLSNLRFHSTETRYAAELQITPKVSGLGQTIVVAFPNLPAGVMLRNPSGVTGTGAPYLNLRTAVPAPGLPAGARSLIVPVEFDNTGNVAFGLYPQFLVGSPNRAPEFTAVANLQVLPGGVLDIPLVATDPDNDPVTFLLAASGPLPNVSLTADGHLHVRPAPQHVGSYQFQLIATDGVALTRQDVSLTVTADSLTTTRVSGIVQRTDGEPLAGINVQIGNVPGLTQADGSFLLDLGAGPVVGDTLKLWKEPLGSSQELPFIAEKLTLVLEHAVYPGVNNVIVRPIYLPLLDLDNATFITPDENVTVTTDAIPGAALLVLKGTLLDQMGTAYEGNLSITEVPLDRTPVALPENVTPDLVVTIQPGEMVFAGNDGTIVGAPLTLPNRAGWAPGTLMDLWSIDPADGTFKRVGTGRVEADGSVIETIRGGVRNSSWHFFCPLGPSADDPGDNPNNHAPQCNEDTANQCTTSEVELHTGSLHERHDLVTYQSLGVTRGVSLQYDSLRADPRPIIHFGYRDTQSSFPDLQLIANLRVHGNGFSLQAPGAASGEPGLAAGDNVWSIPAGRSSAQAALQADLRGYPTGLLTYDVKTRLSRSSQSLFNVGATTWTGELVHVNTVSSPLGSGWGIAGLDELVLGSDGSALLIDGGGSELVFKPGASGSFLSPPGDFSKLEKLADGSFRRTMKDRAVYRFDAGGKLTAVEDRVGNVTGYEYEAGRLARIIDPFGLTTHFAYLAGEVRITDPADRVTRLLLDASGNLVQVIDPDASSRQWQYDDRHLMIQETDQRGFRESTTYDFSGRVVSAVRKGGTTIAVSPVQRQFLFPPTATVKRSQAPSVRANPLATSLVTEANGRVVETQLDQAGQVRTQRDSLGSLPSVDRNDSNLVTQVTGDRGQQSLLEYDALGNTTKITDLMLVGGSNDPIYPQRQYPVSNSPNAVTAADFNSDGALDLAVAKDGSNRFALLLGDGSGRFLPRVDMATGMNSRNPSIVSGDFNNDGAQDIVLLGNLSNSGLLGSLRGDGAGGFTPGPSLAIFDSAVHMLAADFNGDGNLDVVTTHRATQKVAVYKGDGSVGFSLLSSVAFASNVEGITLGHWNADDTPDVAVVREDQTVAVFLNDGAGALSVAGTLTGQGAGAGLSGGLATGQFVGANHADLAVTNGSSVVIFAGDGLGGFVQQTTFPVPNGPSDVVAGDFTGDDIADLFVQSNNSSAPQQGSLLEGDGVGGFLGPVTTFIASNNTSTFLLPADLNDDGVADLAITNRDQAQITVLHSNRGQRLLLPRNIALPNANPRDLLLTDWGQGGAHTAVTTDEAGDRLLLCGADCQSGNGAAVPLSVRGTGLNGDSPKSVATADFDAQNGLDLITANENSDNLSLLVRQANGTLALTRVIPVADRPVFVATGDVNGDRLFDVVSGNIGSTSQSLSVVLNAPNGLTTSALPLATQGFVNDLKIADVTGDGIDDILTITGDERLFVFNGSTQNNFVGRPFVTANSPAALAVGDVNGDGRPDIVVAASGGFGSLTAFLSTGGGNFTAAPASPLDESAIGGDSELALLDVNADGHLDGVFTSPVVRVLKVMLGNGAGGFGTPVTFLSSEHTPIGLAAGDLNQDGRPDLITANFNDASLTIFPSSLPATGGLVRSMTYDPLFSQLVSMTDERGNTTTYDIDPANGNVKAIHRPLGHNTTFTYTAFGQIDKLTDAQGRVTDYDYDPVGRLMRVTFAKGTMDEAIHDYFYDPQQTAGRAGLVTSMRDENGHVTQYAYDALNRLKQITEADPDGPNQPLLSPVTKFGYDVAGNLTALTDANNQVTTYEFDALSRITRQVDPDPDSSGALASPVSTFVYDVAGNLLESRDPLGHITRQRYDARSRLVETIDPDGGQSRLRYDRDDNLIALIDPVQNLTTFAYDARNRQIRETDPLGKAIRYSYDGVNNLIQKIDRNGRQTTYDYDELNRLRREVWGDSVNVIAYDFELVAGQPVGNLQSIADQFSHLTFGHDHRDRLTSVDNLGTPAAPRVVLAYGYDSAGNVTSVNDTISGQPGAATTYEYDALNRLSVLRQSGSGLGAKRVDFAYNAIGQYTSVSRYSDLAAMQPVATTAYAYDGQNRLDLMTHSNSEGSLAYFDLSFDAASRITSILDVNGLTTYGYDDRHQLTSADRGPADPRGDEAYKYDANGNRVQSSLHGAGYLTGLANRLRSDGTYNYEYDHEGNLSNRTHITTGHYREFLWDHRNRLIAVIDRLPNGMATQDVRFTYDALDRRIYKSVDANPADAVAAILTHFIYDREDVILDFVDADGSSGPVTPSLSQRFLHGPAIDHVLAQDDGQGQVCWHLADHLGTIHHVVNNSGDLTEHFRYDSYGNVLSQSNEGNATRYQFTGREFDYETELVYMRTRYYSAGVGTFLSEDPLRVLPPGSYFAYARNSPLTNVDRFGREPTDALKVLEDALSITSKVSRLKDAHDALRCDKGY